MAVFTDHFAIGLSLMVTVIDVVSLQEFGSVTIKTTFFVPKYLNLMLLAVTFDEEATLARVSKFNLGYRLIKCV